MAANDARANDPRSEASKNKDLISRGDYTPTPFGAYPLTSISSKTLLCLSGPVSQQ